MSLRLDDYELGIDGTGNFISSSGSRGSSSNYLNVSSSSRTRSSNSRSRSSSPRYAAGERPDTYARSSRSALRSEDAGVVRYSSRSPSPRPQQFLVVPVGSSLVTASSDYEEVGVKEMVFSKKIVYDKDGNAVSTTDKQKIRYGPPSSSSRNTMEYIQERAVPALPSAAPAYRSKN